MTATEPEAAAPPAIDPLQNPQPRPRRPGSLLGITASGIVLVLVIALIVLTIRLVSEPRIVSGRSMTDPTAVRPAQLATQQSCASFSNALATIRPIQVLLPAGWSPNDPGIDARLRTYTDTMDKAVSAVRIEPNAAPTVRASITDWINTILIGDQVILRKDQKGLASVLGPRLDAAELISRAACGL